MVEGGNPFEIMNGDANGQGRLSAPTSRVLPQTLVAFGWREMCAMKRSGKSENSGTLHSWWLSNSEKDIVPSKQDTPKVKA